MDALTALHHADALHAERRLADAAAAYHEALAADAALHEAWYGLGCVQLALGQYAAAAASLRRMLVLRPDAMGARCNLAEALFQLGALDEVVAEYRRAAEGGDAEVRAIALAALALVAPNAPGCDNFAVFAARRRWIDELGARAERLPAARHDPGRKLRIGYLSAFFGAPNWMKFVWGVINRHDRDRFEIHLLADGSVPSASSGYVDHADDRIWPIAGMPDATLARRIADAGLDVLVDLNGYSAQRRLPLFRYRAARLQVSWMGMYGTTGVPEIDCVVGDAAVIRPDEDRYCCERVVRAPGTYLAFEVLYPTPDLAPSPCLRNGHLTFGCLNSAYKLTDPTLAAFAAILRGAPTSRLLLRNPTLDDSGNRAALLDRLAALGVASERVTLQGKADHFDFLRTYEAVDVALDTFPYNGGTTTAEALWQGVPVLAFNGDRWAARTSRSILLAAGLTDWVAADCAGQVATAVRLASDPATPGRLADLRSGMRERLRRSAACDTAGLCSALEALYVQEAAA